jgi:hypothetical protein
VGVKAIKEKYHIGHIVQVRDGNICIGSSLCHNLITISPEGKVKTTWTHSNGDLKRYMEGLSIDSTSGELNKLFHSVDSFEKVVPVYTHDKGRIVERFCEELGWPNVTTDGELMYDNTFFSDRSAARKHLLQDSRLGVKYSAESLWSAIRESRRISRLSIRLARNVWHYILARVMWR